MKTLVNKVAVGLAISYIITSGFMIFYSSKMTGVEAFHTYLIWGVFGIVVSTLSLIYDLRIAFPIKVLGHGIVTAGLWYATMNYMFSMLDLDMSFPISAVILFLIIYLIIWIITYFIEKRTIAKLNEKFK